MLSPNDSPGPGYYDPLEPECAACVDAGCAGDGFIPGTHEPCCYCLHHASPEEVLAMRGDELREAAKYGE